jgi:hypothetical protein
VDEPGRRVLPVTLKVAVGLLFAQGLALVGLGIWLAVVTLGGARASLGASITEALVAVALGALMGFLAYSLAAGRRWARGPALVLELMLLAVGYFMIQAGVVWAGVLVIVLGLGVGVLLILPSTRESLGIE